MRPQESRDLQCRQTISLTLVLKFSTFMRVVALAAQLLVNPNRLQRMVLSGRGPTKSRVVQYGIILESVMINLTLLDTSLVGPNIIIKAIPQKPCKGFFYIVLILSIIHYYWITCMQRQKIKHVKVCQPCKEENKQMELAKKRKSGACSGKYYSAGISSSYK